GASGSLSWREGDFCRVWTANPSHPIARGIPEHFELDPEEMYGEPFDVAKPDDVVFISWFRGGEVLRSGLTWHRGYGRIFYFQPGHETNPSYQNPHVRRIIQNAVRWAAPEITRESLDCRWRPQPLVSE
ncbi:MAG: ThuA domain-containing protein, partial [Clostridia bacterium]|nr:ThuA domain-containing protein [Clostridia bacterium]